MSPAGARTKPQAAANAAALLVGTALLFFFFELFFYNEFAARPLITGTLATIEAKLDASINRTALILVGPALVGKTDVRSALYSTDYDRRYRPQSADSPFSSIDQDEPQ